MIESTLPVSSNEKTKEFTCIYALEKLLGNTSRDQEQNLQRVVDTIPLGFKYPTNTQVKLSLPDETYETPGYQEGFIPLKSSIIVQNREFGQLTVSYNRKMPELEIGPFLHTEQLLLETIANRLGHYLLNQKLRKVYIEMDESSSTGISRVENWRIILDMIRKTDPALFMRMLRKLLHLLVWKGVEEAEILLIQSSYDLDSTAGLSSEDENKPLKKNEIKDYNEYIEQILRLTSKHFSEQDIVYKVQKWILDDRISELVKSLEVLDSSLGDIADSIRRFFHLAPEKIEISPSTVKGLRVSLLRRFFSDDLDYIKIAKEYVKLTDFYFLIDKMIYTHGSHGKLGGKSSGVFLAYNILRRCFENKEIPFEVKLPKTWHITSDCVLTFMKYNQLEDTYEQKYKDIEEVRLEYPQIVQQFKSSKFPPEIMKGLSIALDDFGEKPIIVRSSSLLEDQLGAAFSGKYKSLFLANQGTKNERLSALMDAVAEVYASTFGPDPIEYRSERELIDFHEEMGIMIMEVVGTKVGHYFLPSFAGVAFSNNEFRWSPRIKREDGLLRIVPGLGTRAVDRVSQDYPILIAPGQPNLRVNITIEEMVKYSPTNIDVINLKTNEFQTIEFQKILDEYGYQFPMITNIISKIDNDMVRQVSPFDLDFENDEYIVTFNGLTQSNTFLPQMKTILDLLHQKFKTPVDVEFAHDGKDLYILQCRPQSYSKQELSEPIPNDLVKEKIIFSANKFVSQGRVPEISHIVYVDPIKYAELPDRESMLDVGRAVGKLNKLLPRRRFILMGPGRWGSKGDIKLGVSVTYSQINNTAMLIEIARQKGNFKPDLSFGTHFFQDLVEANIRYLPLFPDEPNNIFNEQFLLNSPNSLAYLLPEYDYLGDVLRVIEIGSITHGLGLKVFVDVDKDHAVGVLTGQVDDNGTNTPLVMYDLTETPDISNFWKLSMLERMVYSLDLERFGVKSIYMKDINENESKGDNIIELYLELNNEHSDKTGLQNWLDGWSRCMCETLSMNTRTQFQCKIKQNFFTGDLTSSLYKGDILESENIEEMIRLYPLNN